MAKYPVCDGVIVPISGSARAPFDCFQIDGVTQLAWRFLDVPTPISGVGGASASSNIVYCQGVITEAIDNAAGANLSGIPYCSGGWVQVKFDPEGSNLTT